MSKIRGNLEKGATTAEVVELVVDCFVNSTRPMRTESNKQSEAGPQ